MPDTSSATDHDAILKDIDRWAKEIDDLRKQWLTDKTVRPDQGERVRKAEKRIEGYLAAQKQLGWSDTKIEEDKRTLQDRLEIDSAGKPKHLQGIYKAAIDCLNRVPEPLAMQPAVLGKSKAPAKPVTGKPRGES